MTLNKYGKIMPRLCWGRGEGVRSAFGRSREGENRGKEEEISKILIEDKCARYLTIKTPQLWNKTHRRFTFASTHCLAPLLILLTSDKEKGGGRRGEEVKKWRWRRNTEKKQEKQVTESLVVYQEEVEEKEEEM